MRRYLTTALLAAVLTTVWLTTSPLSASAATRTVVVVIAPYLTWQDVTPTSTPTLYRLVETGAAGAINARSRARQQGELSTPLEGALSMSAGSWAVPSVDAAGAYAVAETIEAGAVPDVYKRLFGTEAGSSSVVFLGLPATQRINKDRSFEASLGTLGQSIIDAGGATSAIGNSDTGYLERDLRALRPAGMVAMDSLGRVTYGDVSRALLEPDVNAPFGVRTDRIELGNAIAQTSQRFDTVAGPALAVIDAGDTYRAAKFKAQVTDQVAARQWSAALATLDAVIGMAQQEFPDATLIVTSQASADAQSGRPEGLGPVVVAGPGWSGYLGSSTTQRPGLVTNLDITATALEALGLERPVQVVGNEMTSTPAPAAVTDRIETLSKMAQTAVVIDELRSNLINWFVAATVVVLLFSAIVIVRSRYWVGVRIDRWAAGLKAALLLVLGAPLSAWLMFAWVPRPQSDPAAVMAFLVTLLVVWVAGLVLWKTTPLRVPVAAISLGTAFVLMLDQWLGAPWSFTGFFGYSPLLAARFYGIGNEGAAMLFGATVVGLGLLFDQWADSARMQLFRRWGMPTVAIVALVTTAAPFLGANVGVVAWGIVGFALAWMLMNEQKVSLKAFALMGLAVVAVVGVFIAVDMFGGGAQTHLGRAIGSAEQGGIVELWNIVVRKAQTNARVLTHTNWAYILIAVLVFLGFMRWRPQGEFARTLAESPRFGDAITASLVAGFVAYFTEDSGIVIPALIVFYVGIALAWLMLSRLREPDSAAGEDG
jgi:hypothetical protein